MSLGFQLFEARSQERKINGLLSDTVPPSGVYSRKQESHKSDGESIAVIGAHPRCVLRLLKEDPLELCGVKKNAFLIVVEWLDPAPQSLFHIDQNFSLFPPAGEPGRVGRVSTQTTDEGKVPYEKNLQYSTSCRILVGF